MNRRKLALGIVAGELTVLALLLANAWLQYDRDEKRVVRQSVVTGAAAADEALHFFREHPERRTSDGGETFLKELVARRAPARNETGEEWKLDLHESPRFRAGSALAAALPDVQRKGWNLAILVPFGSEGDGFGGLLAIEHDRRLIAERSVLDPAWAFFQVVLFVFLSFQVALTFVALARRDRITVFEKGYLKEHAIGALKLQHRLLGQIIRDHEEDEAPPARPHEAGRGKVIQLDKAVRKSSEERGPRR